jgi:hypothetical protein
VARHFVQLTVFIVEPEPPAFFLRKVILDGEPNDRDRRSGSAAIKPAVLQAGTAEAEGRLLHRPIYNQMMPGK